MEIVKNLIDPSKYSLKCPYEMTAEFIVVHNTYNDAPAKNEIAYMISNNNETSFHYAIDDKEIVQGIPENRNAWHASDGGKGNGNRKGIAIEICYSKSGGEKFIAAEKLTAKFIAYKLNEKGWGIDKVKKHQDFANKYCPHRTLDMGWNRFLEMVKAELAALADVGEYKIEVSGIVKGKATVDALVARLKANGFTITVTDVTPTPAPVPAPKEKTIEELAREVINGDWGNGAERKNRLTAAGYDYATIQKMVNKLLS